MMPEFATPWIAACRAFGTHAYVVSPKGARALLALCPRANFHVDVAAWGHRSLRLYLATDSAGALLCKQADTDETIIGGLADRSWLPSFTVDEYTGAQFAWAFNAPVLQLFGVVLTIGRSLCSTAALFALAAATGSPACRTMAIIWFSTQFITIHAMRLQNWPSPRVLAAGVATLVAVALAVSYGRAALLLGPVPPCSAALLLGPASLGTGGHIALERAQPGTLPRLRVVGGSVFDEAALVSACSFCDQVLRLKKPF